MDCSAGDFKTDAEYKADQRLKEIIKQAIRETLPEIVAELKKVRSDAEEKSDGDS